MSSDTETTIAPPSAEEKAYLQSQQALAAKQLELLNSQSDYQKTYLEQMQPILDQQTAVTKQTLDQQQAALNDPITKQIQDKSNQLLQQQLDQALNGNAATPEQIAQIDAATKAALATGTSDVNAYAADSYRQLRENLAPGLGLRPTDTPILDRGAQVAKEATRQVGNLTSTLEGANANARLNYPLAASQITQATQTFQAQLADAAATNRLNLMNSVNQGAGLGLNTGVDLVAASKANPLSFQRSTSSSTSDPWGTAAKFATGIGSALMFASDARVKDDVKTVRHDTKGRRWVSFKYKGDPNNLVHVGVIAQEVEKTDPEAVLTNGLGLKFVDYAKLRG